MKRKVTVLIVASILLIATVAMANSSLVIEPIAPVTKVFEPNFDALASYMGYDTDEKFDTFHSTALFMGRYCTTQDSFSYLEKMILSGCDPKTTIDIYQFYLTTNEDISIVRQIYDMVYTGEPITNRDIVFESAFNEITNNKCGVLTEEDVISYLEKGLTVSDISEANLLSRKGVMTIQEILDALLSGTSWETIIETVSGEKISSAYASVDSTTLTSALSVSTITNKPINTILSEQSEEERLSNVAKSVNAQLKAKGYWKAKKSENFDIIAAEAAEKGITEESLTKLMAQGYSELDLMNAISDPACTPQTISDIARNEVTK